MKVLKLSATLNAQVARLLGLLDPLFALSIRLWVGWVFVKSGWLKLTTFESTIFLFTEEYRVPLLAPKLAAVMATGGELVLGALVMAGLAGRLSAIGLSAVNVMAVVSYAHVLYSEGFEAALGQHYLWGFMLAVLIVHGPGSWSLDGLLARFAPRAERATVAVI
jgi:putative oxidoreductase